MSDSRASGRSPVYNFALYGYFSGGQLSHRRSCVLRVPLRANRSGEPENRQVSRFNTRRGINAADQNDRRGTSLSDIAISLASITRVPRVEGYLSLFWHSRERNGNSVVNNAKCNKFSEGHRVGRRRILDAGAEGNFRVAPLFFFVCLLSLAGYRSRLDTLVREIVTEQRSRRMYRVSSDKSWCHRREGDFL